MITVVTPTYNRKELIGRLYSSLECQHFKEFTWLIVDDGSTDGTKEFIGEIRSTATFNIEYLNKGNGGKHTALNIAFDRIKTGWAFFVDSDDYLVDDALLTLSSCLNSLDDEKVVIFQKMFPDGRYMCNPFPTGVNKLSDLIKQGVIGDKSEIYHSSLLDRFRFPVFDTEKFMAESPMHLKFSDGEKIKTVNRPLTICEYLPGGLSESSFHNRLSCIKSTLFVYHFQYEYFRKNALPYLSSRAAINWWRFRILGTCDDSNNNAPLIYIIPALFVSFIDRMFGKLS